MIKVIISDAEIVNATFVGLMMVTKLQKAGIPIILPLRTAEFEFKRKGTLTQTRSPDKNEQIFVWREENEI